MLIKSIAHGFKCSVCGKRSLFLTLFGRHVMCPKCAPRYNKLVSSFVHIDISLDHFVKSFKEAL